MLGEIASHARAGGTFGADEHTEMDRIAALAATELVAPNIAPIARHLFVCSDRRCNALLRWETGGLEAAKKLLSGPIAQPGALAPAVSPTEASAHIVYCRDVLWQAFTQMAKAEGRGIDDLVEDAMTRYQAIREMSRQSRRSDNAPRHPPHAVRACRPRRKGRRFRLSSSLHPPIRRRILHRSSCPSCPHSAR